MRGKGGRGVGIQKGRRASSEERPMILTSKRQKTSEIEIEQKNVCNINIKLFGPKCPSYNIQKDKFIPCYLQIINSRPLSVVVLELLPIQTIIHFRILSNISLLRI